MGVLTCRRGWFGKSEQVWPSGPTPRISRSKTGMESPWKAWVGEEEQSQEVGREGLEGHKETVVRKRISVPITQG